MFVSEGGPGVRTVTQEEEEKEEEVVVVMTVAALNEGARGKEAAAEEPANWQTIKIGEFLLAFFTPAFPRLLSLLLPFSFWACYDTKQGSKRSGGGEAVDEGAGSGGWA